MQIAPRQHFLLYQQMQFTHPHVSGAVGQLGHEPADQLATVLRECLALLHLAVVVRLPALTRHHLLLDRNRHYVQQLRHNVQQMPLCVACFSIRRIGGLGKD